MIYFAYGSNMDEIQMRGRCPSSRFLFAARLPGFRLAFTRRSNKRKCGVADILLDPSSSVWGVVYHIQEEDRAALDNAEGVAVRAYQPFTVYVHPEGDPAQRIKADTYVVVNKEDPSPKPSAEYKRLILDGAIRWQLPPEYLQQLRAIEIQ